MTGSIDRTVLDALACLQQPGQPSLVGRLVEAVLSLAPPQLEALEHAAQARDTAELHRLAHKLKSTSANIGARNAAALCARLETSADRAEAVGFAAELCEAYPDIERELREYCEKGR